MADKKMRKPKPFKSNHWTLAVIREPTRHQPWRVEWVGTREIYRDECIEYAAWLIQAAAWIEQQERTAP